MDTPVLNPGPALGVPLPVTPVIATAPSGFARVVDLAEGIVYWGILGFGFLFPICAAVYAFLQR